MKETLHVQCGNNIITSCCLCWEHHKVMVKPYKSFNGTTDYISVPSTVALQLNQFTISAWFRTSKDYSKATPRDSAGEEGMILIKGMWADRNTNVSYGLWVTDHNGLRGGFETHEDIPYLAKIPGGSKIAPDGKPYADPMVNDGDWHNGIITHDGARIKLYLDSVLKDNRATNGAKPEVNITSIFIGRNSKDSDPMWFQGDLDDVNVWNDDLSDNEISTFYKTRVLPKPNNIVYRSNFG